MSLLDIFKKKKENDFEQEKLAAEVVYDIGQQRENLEKLVATYRESAYEAAKMGQDDYVNELLTDVADIRQFIEDLRFIELKIKTTALTTKTFKVLRKLPDALASCKSALSKGVKVGKLGENFRDLLKSLDGARSQFSEIRNAISSESERASRSMFGDLGISTNPKAKKLFDEEQKALEAKLACESVAPAPVAQDAAAEDAEAAARVDAIAAMLDEEKRK